jgi:hypothetical protein
MRHHIDITNIYISTIQYFNRMKGKLDTYHYAGKTNGTPNRRYRNHNYLSSSHDHDS